MTEHVTELNPAGVDKLRAWLVRPNGSLSMGRVTFESVERGGILVRTRPYTGPATVTEVTRIDGDPAAITRPAPRYIAHFTPEAWQRGNAVQADPLGEQEWDVTAYAADPEFRFSDGTTRLEYLDWLHRCAQSNGEPDLDSDEGVLDNDDAFREDPAAPEWVRQHQGPFTLRVRRESYLPGTLVREGHPGDVNDPERYPEG